MPYIKIFVHTVWATKHRHPYLSDIKQQVIKHIRENAKEKTFLLIILMVIMNICTVSSLYVPTRILPQS